jgi:hypothetical protein
MKDTLEIVNLVVDKVLAYKPKKKTKKRKRVRRRNKK